MKTIARVLVCIVLAQGLTGCDRDKSPAPLPVAAALPPPPTPSVPPPSVEAWHGFFEGRITIGDEQRWSEALLTADGAVRMSVAPWESAGSAQFVGTFEQSGGQGSGSGIIIGQDCAGSSPGRFCSAPAFAEISITVATRDRLSGEIRVSTDAGQESWSFGMHWPAGTYLERATLEFAAGLYDELLAEFADDGSVIVSVDSAGRLFFQSAQSGCVGNGALAPHLDAEFNVYDVTLTIASCTSVYEYLNGEFEGLATRAIEHGGWYVDWGDALVFWLTSAGTPTRAAITMWGSRIN